MTPRFAGGGRGKEKERGELDGERRGKKLEGRARDGTSPGLSTVLTVMQHRAPSVQGVFKGPQKIKHG